MTFEEAKLHLTDALRHGEGELHSLASEYIGWTYGDGEITLDGNFTPADLEAITIYVREYKPDVIL